VSSLLLLRSAALILRSIPDSGAAPVSSLSALSLVNVLSVKISSMSVSSNCSGARAIPRTSASLGVAQGPRYAPWEVPGYPLRFWLCMAAAAEP